MATKKNLKASAEKGSLLSIIGLVVINAEDQRIINIKGNIFIMLKNVMKLSELSIFLIILKLILDNYLIETY